MLVNITRISETDYTEEMPVGQNIEIESLESLVASVAGQLNGNRIIVEWGNGEGFDEFEVEVFDSTPGNLNLYVPAGYKAKAEFLADKFDLRDNRGNASISALFRYLIDQELATHTQDKQEQKIDTKFEQALAEFQYIASHTDGFQGRKWRSSEGYEFVIWIDEGDEAPQPESDLIETTINTDDDTFDGMYKFSMVLPA